MISFSVSQIAELVKGQLIGDGNRPISGAAGLLEATETDLSFFHNPKYIDDISQSKAAAILIPEKSNGDLPIQNKTIIKVSNPQWAFAQVLGLIEKTKRHHPKGIHPSAVISPSAKIGNNVAMAPHVVIGDGASVGDNTILYPGCYIGEGSTVGSNCLFYANVVLREDVHVGDRVIMHPGVVLGSDGYGFATVQGIHHKIPQIGKVVVGDDVEIGANVTVDRATTGETRIGAGTKIDNLVHIAHNVHIGKGCLIVAQVGISGSTTIGNYVTLAGQVGITGHLTIGDGAVIAAQSGIMNNVKAKEVLFGTPGRPIKQEMKLQALYGKLPEIYDAVRIMKKKILPANEE